MNATNTINNARMSVADVARAEVATYLYGLFANDEERGRLDLFMAYPIPRSQAFLARLAGLITATLLIFAGCWLGVIFAVPHSVMELSFTDSLLPFANLLAPVFLFQALALLFSCFMPSRRLAAGAAGVLLVFAFFIELFYMVDPRLLPIARCFPLHYYAGGEAINDFELLGFSALMGIAILFFILSWYLFLKRDIRVMGEAGFQWRLFRRQKATA